VDFAEFDVDIYCAGGVKWIYNPMGMVFLYVSKKIMDKFNPFLWGCLNSLEPDGGWDNSTLLPLSGITLNPLI
jgi:selenocysteine lyase/cysteine desulfurase